MLSYFFLISSINEHNDFFEHYIDKTITDLYFNW